jgi:SPP1 gp7 family putative phage head morphogenesis protein
MAEKTANEEFLDAMIRHQIYLLRYSGYVRNKISELLSESEKDIAEKILVRLARGTGLSTPAEVSRMNALKDIIHGIRMESWNKADEFFQSEMKELAYKEQIHVGAVLQTVVPVVITTVMPSASLLKTMVLDLPFEGVVMKEWVSSLAKEDLRRINTAVQLGTVAGESAQDITKRVFGSVRLMGTDGTTELTRRQVGAVVRTAVQHVANNSRNLFMNENSELFRLEQFVATLDSRTTPVCRANDGKRFPIGKGPIPPLHYSCRSLRVAVMNENFIGDRPSNPTTERTLVVQYAEENGLGAVKTRNSLPRGTKGKYDKWAREELRKRVGPIPSSTNYQEWLSGQSKMFQEDVLGKTKAKLFRDGHLKLDKFVNRAGDELTLHELAQYHSDAFRAAGLNPADF